MDVTTVPDTNYQGTDPQHAIINPTAGSVTDNSGRRGSGDARIHCEVAGFHQHQLFRRDWLKSGVLSTAGLRRLWPRPRPTGKNVDVPPAVIC